MQKKGRETPDWNAGRFICGDYYTYLVGTKAFTKRYDCDAWKCHLCHPRKVKAFIKKIDDECGVHVFTSKVSFDGKKLSRYIDSHIRKGIFYIALRLADKAIVISSHTFEGARRRDKRNFLTNICPKLFKDIKAGRRISTRREKKIKDKRVKSEDSASYGVIAGWKISEWRALKTEEDRSWWLFNKCARLGKKGKQIVDKYVYGKPDVTVKEDNKKVVRKRVTTIKA